MSETPPPTGDQPASSDEKSPRTGLTARYLAAVAEEVGDDTLTPIALTRAAVRVLGVDGAGLSTMVSVLRQPLAASSDDCRQAEELQTSLGEGPCLDAAEAQAAIVADLAELEARWPLYTEELTAKTAFRAVAAVPLQAPGHGVFAALDLYSTGTQLTDVLHPSEVEEVAETAGALLTACVAQIQDVDSPEAGPDWYRSASGRRHDVWVAIGMVMGMRAERTRDALSVLRAHAYSVNRSLDDFAADLVQGRVPLNDLRG